jgi:putative ABC transport system permease protein
MNLLETGRLALRSLSLQKFRALLTTLGIVIGVAAVIAMLSISEGARRETLQQIKVLGVNNVRVRSVKPVITERKQEEQSNNEGWIFKYGVKRAELDHFRVVAPEVLEVVPLREVRKDVWSRDVKTDIRVVGTTPEFARILDYRASGGRWLGPLDERGARTVCVLGSEARRKLFRTRSWEGQDVKVGNAYFRVVGVMEEKPIKASGAFAVADLNNQVYVPYETVMQVYGALSVKGQRGAWEAISVEVDEAILRVAEEGAITTVGRLLRRAMERTHPLGDFEVVVPLELLHQSQKTQRTFTIVMASIAALSLLVGGIGIMNIMLANVAERRKEIGTRRALGARKRDIRLQFLMESVMLSLLGGLAGVAFGTAGSQIIQRAAGWPTVVSGVAVALAFVVAAATGIVFGTFPAIQAAAVDPIVALREE